MDKLCSQCVWYVECITRLHYKGLSSDKMTICSTFRKPNDDRDLYNNKDSDPNRNYGIRY